MFGRGEQRQATPRSYSFKGSRGVKKAWKPGGSLETSGGSKSTFRSELQRMCTSWVSVRIPRIFRMSAFWAANASVGNEPLRAIHPAAA